MNVISPNCFSYFRSNVDILHFISLPYDRRNIYIRNVNELKFDSIDGTIEVTKTINLE